MRIRLSILPMIVAVAITASAATDYEKLSDRAERAFSYQEWNSALAMYELMIDSRPLEIPTYYKAIVTGGMIDKDDIQISMLERTQNLGIALDSIFSGVKNVSFAIGEGDTYEKFLKLVRERQPWLTRSINTYLLEYYDFRNDAENMIEMAETLLKETPDNVQYVRILAKAYMMAGRAEDGIKCYKHIVGEYPQDYDSLLNLGLYYNRCLGEAAGDDVADCSALAETYLAEAYSVRPTPYVAHLLSVLRSRK